MNTAAYYYEFLSKRRRRDLHVKPNQYKRLELIEWSEHKCISMTRFTQAQITQICDLADIDSQLRFNSLLIARELALAILLVRLSFPQRLADMAIIFGMSEHNISRTVNGMSNLLFEKFKTGIEFDERQFSRENCERFSKALYQRGAYFSNVVGFIDGTMQQTCRPKDIVIQKQSYNRQKQIHCIKYQAISTPDGITSSLCGPYTGSGNDQDITKSSELISRLVLHFEKISPDKAFAIYGDEGYSWGEHILSPFPKETMTEIEKNCNKSMSKVRVAVEMELGKTAQFFSATKWKRGNRILQTKPALKYILASIFKNFHTCLHGSSIASNMFKLKPPTLEEYILGLMRERNENDILE